MQRRLKVIHELVLNSSYIVDADLVAEAIVDRARARQLIPAMEFRNDTRPTDAVGDGRTMTAGRTYEVRSFRPAPIGRTFRLSAPRRTRDAEHLVGVGGHA
jgi:hypothetical protein